jgi:uncharacterized membrane protein HdeD (DUF308 family)
MKEKEADWSYWILIITLIADLIIGLNLLIKPESISSIQFTLIGVLFIFMAFKAFFVIVLKFIQDKIKQHGK